jgi:hypothetical protein
MESEPVDAAAAQREARKKAAKEAREAESARVRAVLFPGADDQKNFEAKTKVPLTLRSASTRSASKTGGRPTAGNPPARWPRRWLRLRSPSWSRNLARAKPLRRLAKVSRDMISVTVRPLSLPSPAGKTPYKIPRVSAYGRRPTEDPKPSTSGAAAGDQIVEEGEISLDALTIDGAGDAAPPKEATKTGSSFSSSTRATRTGMR